MIYKPRGTEDNFIRTIVVTKKGRDDSWSHNEVSAVLVSLSSIDRGKLGSVQRSKLERKV